MAIRIRAAHVLSLRHTAEPAPVRALLGASRSMPFCCNGGAVSTYGYRFVLDGLSTRVIFCQSDSEKSIMSDECRAIDAPMGWWAPTAAYSMRGLPGTAATSKSKSKSKISLFK
ncbi:jg3155 [Pararge aegeria aegeria]|uniref:Jg3155 protein n=1 Tax=Pararge aegeria aegeria TaxID=348720 RepID=A0A8S4QH81_9NEOP|nr:jg3155 [Pararge aegeria aegeria]